MDLGSNIVTNGIAGLSLVISIVVATFFFRDRRHAKFIIENEYTNRLLEWHSAVVEVLITLRHTTKDSPSDERYHSLIKLSALIEQGRFFFPNINQESGYGHDKPLAYRGYRNVALDFLVASYNLHHKQNPSEQVVQAENLQRLFTSIVFEIVLPKKRLETIRDLTDRYFVKDMSVESLVEKNQLSAISHMWDIPE